MKPSRILAAVRLLCIIALGACRTYPDNTNDFRFPIVQGSVARGEQAFVKLGCSQCHLVNGIELPAYAGTRPVTVELGGDLVFAKTYGDLVTSIINPDHIISERYLNQFPRSAQRAIDSSPMYMNPEMKVTELIDIVAFLNSRYSLLPGYTEYYY
jgi:cytochrome c2